MSDWSEFYEITRNKPPSPLLVKSLKFVVSKNKALDLGAGSLRDTKFLLSSGFKSVTAVDSDSSIIKEGNTVNDKRLEIANTSFDSFNYQPGEYDLLSAQFSLPFEVPDKFKDVWNKIKSSIRKNGIFTGQFFGVNDEWNIPGKKMTFHTKDE